MKKCQEDADKESRARDDLVEAGRKLLKAKTREAKSSGLGVKALKQAWKAKRGKA